MKKIIPVLISLSLVFALCACSGNTPEEETTEGETSAEEIVSETTTIETITGDLYAVMSSETRTNQFVCSGGTVTPERIAAGFTGWTGINFGLISETDEATKTIKIEWKATSAMATGDMSTANEGFEFNSADEMKKFMTDSITETIKNNMGDYTITFEVAE